jgi:hypothetical protein
VLGYVEYRHNGKLVSKVDVIAAESIPDKKGGLTPAQPAGTVTNRLLGVSITSRGSNNNSSSSSSSSISISSGSSSSNISSGGSSSTDNNGGNSSTGSRNDGGTGSGNSGGDSNVNRGNNSGNTGGNSNANSDNSGNGRNGGAGDGDPDAPQSEPQGFFQAIVQNEIARVALMGVLALAVIISLIRTVNSVLRAGRQNQDYGSSRSRAIKNYKKRSRWY